ncbi:hypothetical protein C1645_742286 [Glomus cerebriforme]|uniref:Uncharacterized protein n=1 Tax=Glomus cerebriforme TaxID=658196 RepID=A0A397SE25_9GLOM|nr:hypothetical protein C1645_742286 [Glomus cerebriforme]
MENTYEILNENREDITAVETNFINAPSYEYESTPLSISNFQPSHRMVSRPNNVLLMYQKIQRFSNFIKTFEENVSEQIDELKNQLDEMKQFLFVQQQQSSMPRRINRTRVLRPHPYEHPFVSSHTPTIRPTARPAPTDRNECFMTDQPISSNNFHSQQMNIPTVDNNEIFSATGSQNFEFW